MSLLLSALMLRTKPPAPAWTMSKLAVGCTRSREAIALLSSSASYEGEWCVAQPVTVVHKKHFLGSQIGLDREQALAEIGVYSSFNERDLPVINISVHRLDTFPDVRPYEVVRNGFFVM